MDHSRVARCRPLRLTLMAAAAALATAAWAQPTPTATPPAAEAAPLETITISARKRLEASQSVPVAVSAFSADSLERARITGPADLQFSIPNAVLKGNDNFTIRGIGNNSLGGDNGVGLAINGATIAVFPQDELFDLERIEVLRGPQGTLFGRNTTGGALSIFTKRPTARLEGKLSLELGNFNHRRAEGMFNLPVSDDLRFRVAGYALKRDGFTKNEFTGNGVDGRDQYSVRASGRLFLGDKTEINLVAGTYDEKSTRTRETKRQCKAIPVLGCSPNEFGFDSPDYSSTVFVPLVNFFLVPAGVVAAGSNIYTGAANPRDLRAVAADQDASYRLKNTFATLDVTHEFAPFTLTYVAGYSDSDTEQNTDWDNAALPFRFLSPQTYSVSRDRVVTTDRLLTTDSFTAKNETWSHELRIASRNTGPFSYTTGLFYYDSKGSGGFFIWHPIFELSQKLRGRPAETWFINGETKLTTTEAKAWFGEGQWKLNEQLRATLGARWISETRNSLSRNLVLAATATPFVQRPTIKADWWTGRASIDYAPAKDALVYATLATGYKGGGFNAGNATRPEYEPETVTAYEAGLKLESMGGRLRTNFSVFLNEYKNMQLSQRISGSTATSNVDAQTSGVEAELLFAPTRAWLLDANLSLLETRIGNFLTVDAANPGQSLTTRTPEVEVNLRGNALPHAPTAKVKLGAQYTMGLFGTGWTVTTRLDHVWQNEYFAREFNTPTDRIRAWDVTNLQLRFASPKGDIEVKAFVKNLRDNDHVTNIIIEDALVGSYRNVRLLDPRTMGVQVQYTF